MVLGSTPGPLSEEAAIASHALQCIGQGILQQPAGRLQLVKQARMLQLGSSAVQHCSPAMNE